MTCPHKEVYGNCFAWKILIPFFATWVAISWIFLNLCFKLGQNLCHAKFLIGQEDDTAGKQTVEQSDKQTNERTDRWISPFMCGSIRY